MLKLYENICNEVKEDEKYRIIEKLKSTTIKEKMELEVNKFKDEELKTSEETFKKKCDDKYPLRLGFEEEFNKVKDKKFREDLGKIISEHADLIIYSTKLINEVKKDKESEFNNITCKEQPENYSNNKIKSMINEVINESKEKYPCQLKEYNQYNDELKNKLKNDKKNRKIKKM